jgi:hypothetical protein
MSLKMSLPCERRGHDSNSERTPFFDHRSRLRDTRLRDHTVHTHLQTNCASSLARRRDRRGAPRRHLGESQEISPP